MSAQENSDETQGGPSIDHLCALANVSRGFGTVRNLVCGAGLVITL